MVVVVVVVVVMVMVGLGSESVQGEYEARCRSWVRKWFSLNAVYHIFPLFSAFSTSFCFCCCCLGGAFVPGLAYILSLLLFFQKKIIIVKVVASI